MSYDQLLYDQVLEVAIRAAREGGKIALEHLGKHGSVKWKGSQDVVMPSIMKVQERILEIIRSEFPDHAILSEELDEVPDPQAELLWIIDPINGSLNYMKGIPFFAVSIAFRHEDVYRVGVIYDPNRDELFHAVHLRNAYLNGRQIITDQQLDGTGIDAFQAAIIATGWPAQVSKRPTEATIIENMVNDLVSLLILGSPALSMCYIAAGRLDGYFHLQLELWDVAAAVVILEETGGVLTNIDGSTWQYSDGGYVASNGVIHGRILAPIRLIRAKPS